MFLVIFHASINNIYSLIVSKYFILVNVAVDQSLYNKHKGTMVEGNQRTQRKLTLEKDAKLAQTLI